MSVAMAEVMAPFEGRELIGLPELGDRLGQTVGLDMDRAARTYAVTSGAITPAAQRGPNGRYQVTWDDAVMLVLAAMFAAAAGLAIVTALRGFQGMGLSAADLAGLVSA